jgi:hypothetical protein
VEERTVWIQKALPRIAPTPGEHRRERVMASQFGLDA